MDGNLFNRISRGLIWNQLRHYALYPLTFLLSIVLARGLGPEAYGAYAGILALIGILILISSLGLEAVSLIYLPKISREKYLPKTSYFIKRVIITRGLISLLISLIILLLPKDIFSLLGLKGIDFHDFVFVIIAFFLLTNMNTLLSSFYKGLLRFKSLYAIDTVAYSLNVILCFFILRYTKDLNIVFSALILSQLFILIIYITGIKSSLFHKSEKFNFRDINALSLNLYGTRFLQFALGKQKDILLISYFLQNPMFLGFYSVAVKLTEAFNNLFTMGFGEVTQPSFAEVYVEKRNDGLINLWDIFMRLEMFLTIPCLIFALLQAEHIIIIFFSDKYIPVVPIFKLFCLMLLISSGFLGGGTSQKVFYAMSRQDLAFRIVLSAAIVNIVLSLLLINNYGVMGAVIATGIAMIYWRILELIYVIRIIKVEFPLQFLIKVILTVSVSAFLSSIIKVEGILSLFISGSVFIALFLFLNYIFKPFKAFDGFGMNAVNPYFLRLVGCFCKD